MRLTDDRILDRLRNRAGQSVQLTPIKGVGNFGIFKGIDEFFVEIEELGNTVFIPVDRVASLDFHIERKNTKYPAPIEKRC